MDIHMVGMEWYLMGRDNFPIFLPSFHFLYSSLPFLSFFLFVFLFSSFSSLFLLLFFLLFVYCNFFEKKKITFEDFT